MWAPVYSARWKFYIFVDNQVYCIMMKVDKISGRRIAILFAAIISGFILNVRILAQAEISAFNFDLDPTYVETIDPATQVIDVEIYYKYWWLLINHG